jgi:hypothetical protein
VDGLAYHVHRPMDCGFQALVQSPLTGIILSHHLAQVGIVSDPLSRGAKPSGRAS